MSDLHTLGPLCASYRFLRGRGALNCRDIALHVCFSPPHDCCDKLFDAVSQVYQISGSYSAVFIELETELSAGQKCGVSDFVGVVKVVSFSKLCHDPSYLAPPLNKYKRCFRLEAALRRMISVWHQSTARAIRKYNDTSALLSLSRYFDVIHWSFCAAPLQVEHT